MRSQKLLVLLLIVLPLSSFSSYHKFYVSVTQIEYVPKEQSLQIITRIFADDFQKLLRQRYDESLQLVAGKDDHADQYIEKYFKKKMHLVADGQSLQLKFIGKRYEEDLIICYFEVKPLDDFNKITVTNRILTELFDGQKNLIHVTKSGETKSLLLVADEPKGTINF